MEQARRCVEVASPSSGSGGPAAATLTARARAMRCRLEKERIKDLEERSKKAEEHLEEVKKERDLEQRRKQMQTTLLQLDRWDNIERCAATVGPATSACS